MQEGHYQILIRPELVHGAVLGPDGCVCSDCEYVRNEPPRLRETVIQAASRLVGGRLELVVLRLVVPGGVSGRWSCVAPETQP